MRNKLRLKKEKWPMSFHKDVKLESIMNGTLISESESSRMNELFVHAEQLKGALFYDPQNDRIVAEGTHSNERPLAHSVMNAIESLSAKQTKETNEKSAQYLATVSMIVGVVKTGNAFAIFEPGPSNYLEERFARFRIKFALFDASLPLDEDAFRDTAFVEAGPLKIGRLKNGSGDTGTDTFVMEQQEILYAIQTSGSTGIPKVVLVPFSSIMPNVEDFIDRFSLTASSTVLYSTQTNFDPSMVELLVALSVGCELLIPPPSGWIGSVSRIILRDFRLSFVQLTPAVLQCLSTDILRHIFGRNSLIDTLLIGGDNFPLNLMKNYYKKECPMAVYNVYGLTEVSCWASIHRFKTSDSE
uniref:AMP-binding domain-containing protein n=1 Tax=Globodera pallida TaxID=36090 RepID=A0A183CP20_GLOPA